MKNNCNHFANCIITRFKYSEKLATCRVANIFIAESTILLNLNPKDLNIKQSIMMQLPLDLNIKYLEVLGQR